MEESEEISGSGSTLDEDEIESGSGSSIRGHPPQLIQSTLNFNGSSLVSTRATSEMGEHSVAEWVKQLSPFFGLTEKFLRSKRTTYKMKCLECPGEVLITDKGHQKFSDHLQNNHPVKAALFRKEQEKAAEKKKKDILSVRIHAVPTKIVTGPQPQPKKELQRYRRTDGKQVEFTEKILEFIAMDCMPLCTTEGQGFKNLIAGIDPRLTSPCAKTVKRLLSAKSEKVMEIAKKELRSVDDKCVTIIMDIWSSRQKRSVVGFTAQYCLDWRIKQSVCGFQDFPEAHTGQNIRKRVHNFLFENLGLKMEQVFSVTADNCANILAAFKMDGIELDVNEQDVAEENDVLEADEENEGVQALEEIDEIGNGEDIAGSAPGLSDSDELESVSSHLDRNPCLAHLLQLAVKDSISSSSVVAELLKKKNKIVVFFHQSNKYYTALRDMNGGLSLLKPCVTRWNSQYHCLKRITSQGVKKSCMIQHINNVLAMAKDEKGRNSGAVPGKFSRADAEALNIIRDILTPCANLTDALQGDGVTSSLVLPGVVHAVNEINDVKIPETDPELNGFKTKLMECIMERFSTDKSGGEKVFGENGKVRNIFTVDIFGTKSYVMAAFLDPRFKSRPFRDTASSIEKLQRKIPKHEDVLKMAKREVLRIQTNVTGDDHAVQRPPPQKKFKSSLFKKMNEIGKELGEELNECEKYSLQPVVEDEDLCPLQFWKLQVSKFPSLAILAKIYLSFPASSGGVERLFSVAGAIGRARRARISTTTLEQLLSYRQYLRNVKNFNDFQRDDVGQVKTDIDDTEQVEVEED